MRRYTSRVRHRSIVLSNRLPLRWADWRLLLSLGVATLSPAAGCFHRPSRALPADGPVALVVTPETINAADVYRRAGFLAATGDIRFVGAPRFLAGADPENTVVVIAFSFPNRDLTFSRDGDQYRAAYDVSYDVRSGTSTVQHRSGRSEVRVGSFRETTRSEESVIAQQVLVLAPGAYTLEITARDAGGTSVGRVIAPLAVPPFRNDGTLSVTPVYQVAPRDARSAASRLLVNPRATVVFGRDSLLQLYVESYGIEAPAAAEVEVSTPGGGALYLDTVPLSNAGSDVHSAIARLPAARIGLGLLSVTVSPHGRDGSSIRLPIVVRPGDELAVASFAEMLQYLRFFVSPERLRALRDTAPEARGLLWATLLRDTDALAATPENEAMRDYLRRVQTANTQFREDNMPGWLTDRGKTFSAFGQPDHVSEPSAGGGNGRGVTLIWDYRDKHLQLVFVDQTGVGHFRLTPSSQLAFDAAFKRLTSCTPCR